ncbi:transporter substrate-binding domain-containing protein [Hahella sp. KA22]|uniref:substrate-binding periplasmic protein n=1 Tax=Hahella sp. KA22 TaxID=1628392 RepID=UPI000FDD4346|nr:transporter substrate-binding domain-containing protein [Hahella sp. KA22]AZZ91840.1 amino acid ABC transporter substrate-binding protein [Hahella sp. KA22]QAY55211.1 transporter substrate-binding domain-containing protein [Hahella sp. KA22]
MKKLYLALISLIMMSGIVKAETVELVTLQYPPYQYQEEDEVQGLVVNIVNEAFRRVGMDTNIRLNAWPRSLEMVRSGQADAIFTAYKTPEREEFLHYSNVVLMPQEIVLFAKKDSNISFNGDLTALANVKIGVVRDISYGSTFDEARKNGMFKQISETTNLEQSVKKLESGRIDLLISNKYTALAMFKNLGFAGQFKELTPSIQSVPSYIAFSKKKDLAGLRDKFDGALKEMMSDGSYDKYLSAYSD